MQSERQIDDSIHGTTNTLRAIEAIDAAVATERERCAAIAEKVGREYGEAAVGHSIAKQIRALTTA